VLAQLDRAQIVKRLRDGKRLKAARGGRAGGRSPYGWTAEDGVLVPDPDQQQALARMVELRAGGASLRRIGAVLEAEGAPLRGAARWHPATVAAILRRAGEGEGAA
jgi:DNA invertase Pin-like site-specific DNA recombinase